MTSAICGGNFLLSSGSKYLVQANYDARHFDAIHAIELLSSKLHVLLYQTILKLYQQGRNSDNTINQTLITKLSTTTKIRCIVYFIFNYHSYLLPTTNNTMYNEA